MWQRSATSCPSLVCCQWYRMYRLPLQMWTLLTLLRCAPLFPHVLQKRDSASAHRHWFVRPITQSQTLPHVRRFNPRHLSVSRRQSLSDAVSIIKWCTWLCGARQMRATLACVHALKNASELGSIIGMITTPNPSAGHDQGAAPVSVIYTPYPGIWPIRARASPRSAAATTGC